MNEISNKAIAKLLNLTASLMELVGGNSFKITALQRGARAIETLGQAAIDLLKNNQLSDIQGVGSSIQKHVAEIAEKGTFAELEKLQSEVPTGVQEILKIKGLGAKKVQQIWHKMGIETVGELYYACVENRLAQEKGFGEKTQANIQKAIEYAQNNQGKYHYARILPYAEQLLHNVQLLTQSPRIELSGEMRRKCEVISTLEILLVGKASDFPALYEQHPETFFSLSIAAIQEKQLHFIDDALKLKIILYFCEEKEFVKTGFETTATPEHLQQIGSLSGEYQNEEEIYASLQLPYILPELREGRGEIEKAKAGKFANLIEISDIKGVIHAHSAYSDGANSLKEMAVACKKLGYEYLVISDHSKAAFYANGLSEGRIEVQHQEIDKLNKELAPFRIFKGIEADILNDGSLDYEETVWKSFECIIASVHSNLRMDKEKAHTRLIKAIENPYTKILGHPTGRLLLTREGYPIDHKYIIDACAANQVVIELNANPMRLDIDWRWIEYAIQKGVKISINPDAHSLAGIQDIQFGVLAARKGGLLREMCFNTLNIAEMTAYLHKS
ncbi:MAG: helix-hairpin-helix domain-containing protein [Bacteroidia bacterium]